MEIDLLEEGEMEIYRLLGRPKWKDWKSLRSALVLMVEGDLDLKTIKSMAPSDSARALIDRALRSQFKVSPLEDPAQMAPAERRARAAKRGWVSRRATDRDRAAEREKCLVRDRQALVLAELSGQPVPAQVHMRMAERRRVETERRAQAAKKGWAGRKAPIKEGPY